MSSPRLTQEEISRLDSTVMPFGKFKGRAMREVPAEYLDWLRDGDWNTSGDFPEVAEYLEKMAKYIDDELRSNKNR